VALGFPVRFSTVQDASSSTTPHPSSPQAVYHNISVVASQTLVSAPDVSPERRTVETTAILPAAQPGSSRSDCLPSITTDITTSRRAFIEHQLRRRQITPRARTLILAAIRRSSAAVYERHWSHFTAYLRQCSVTFADVNETLLVKFFSYKFEKHGFSYAKLQSIRSALALPLRLALGLKIGKFVLLQQTLAGIRRAVPPSRPPLLSWNLDEVLKFLRSTRFEPLSEKNEDVIFAKTLFLVALTTGLRVSELCALGSSPSFFPAPQDGLFL
jgi:hypothetical protein